MKYLKVISIKIFIVILILAAPFTIFSQEKISASIFGTIKDQQSGAPIENVNVYIANSLFGASSDEQGYYRIDNLPAGVYNLIVSHVSYYLEEVEIVVDDKNSFNFDYLLLQKVYELPQLSVEGEEDDDWKDMFEIFSTNLIGVSKNSEKTTILNSYVINFQYDDDDILVASADVPLIIENKALGYKISYFLNSFEHGIKNTKYSGMPVFEELEPEDSVQKNEWEENRLRAYAGSLRHFLATISTNKKMTAGKFSNVRVISEIVSEVLFENHPDNDEDYLLTYSDTLYVVKQGFNIIHLAVLNFQPSKSPLITLVNTNKFLYKGKTDIEYIFQFPKYLQIVYDREKEERQFLESIGNYTRLPDKQVSAIRLNAPSVTIDHKGRHIGDVSIETFGYWSFERLADLLPNEYEVPDSVLISYDRY
jgi:hypothetical protein